ncbi:MAG: ABC transporter ATP-binding protein [Malacoplasma sp.]|nr:ABC transporter ATP-binding protein [Malacoplasma sp.]MDE6082830.1 ABC transporter ATP-binding protein [Malacoplasma sp.]
MKSEILISIQNLCKEYEIKKEKKAIYDDFSLNIYKGDRLGLLGKNGAGKTTLINIIIGKTSFQKGSITFSKNISDKMLDISYLPQEFQFPPIFTVKNILKIIKSDLERNKKFNKDFFEFIFNKLNIDSLLNKKYSKLSGGEKQKINLVSVILYNPKILILDEFSSNIDIETSFTIREILEKLNSTLIVISHSAKEISEVCNRLVFLKNGKIFSEIKNKKNITENSIKKTFKDMED